LLLNKNENAVRKLMNNGGIMRYFYFTLFMLLLLMLGCSDNEGIKNGENAEPEEGYEVYEVPEGSENWPTFRGVNGSGLTRDQDLPLKWDVEKGTNIKWIYKTPGLGLSSPIIWKDRVFITTAVHEKEDEPLRVGLYGDVASVKDDKEHVWKLICLDRESGKVIWIKEAYKGIPKVKRHTKSSHANSTAATDGKRVVVMFGSEGLYGYDFDGKLLWKKDLGILDSGFYVMPEAQWEFASSPVIHEGKVILQCDVQKNSFLMSIDISNGETLWKTDRDEVPTWSTPAIFVGNEKTQIIVNGYKHIGSYDLNTGKPIWWLKGGGDIPIPTPVIASNHVFIVNAHGRMRPIYAINLQAEGDISLKDKEESNKFITWFNRRKGAYIPTPLIYGDYLYICRINGILACFDIKTGEEIYKERIARQHSAYSASPVAADGKIYFTDEYGDIHIIKAGKDYKLLSSNKLGEVCLATPAISGNTLFVRTTSHLYAIGKGGSTKGGPVKRKTEAKPVKTIDFEKIVKDGSLKDVAKIREVAISRMQIIKGVNYDGEAIGLHSQVKSSGTTTAKVSFAGFAEYFPKYIKVDAETKKSDPEVISKVTGGLDGYKFYVLDHDKKTIISDLEYGEVAQGFRPIQSTILLDFTANKPLEIEKEAKTKTLQGIKKINGEDCYEVFFQFPQYNNYEITWYFSIKDFLPRAKKVVYSMQQGKKGGYYLVLKNLEIIAKIDPEKYKFEIPEGYKTD
jgi:outer membrane protein assembly factor BamB